MPAAEYRGMSQSPALARGCLGAIFLVLVVLPVAGFVFAVWLLFTPTAEETAAATAYEKASVCSSSQLTQKGCIHNERAEIASYSSTVGRCGSRTERFTLKLADGLHKAEISLDCLAVQPSYGWSDGRLNVREYEGLVTTVYDAGGKAYETTDSPSHPMSWRRGVAAVMLIFLGPWLILVAIFAIAVVFKRAWGPNPGEIGDPDPFTSSDKGSA
jgi:hypothetical protein